MSTALIHPSNEAHLVLAKRWLPEQNRYVTQFVPASPFVGEDAPSSSRLHGSTFVAASGDHIRRIPRAPLPRGYRRTCSTGEARALSSQLAPDFFPKYTPVEREIAHSVGTLGVEPMDPTIHWTLQDSTGNLVLVAVATDAEAMRPIILTVCLNHPLGRRLLAERRQEQDRIRHDRAILGSIRF